MSSDQTIIYTLTDEAPALATRAFLPVIRTFAKPAGIRVDTSDISVAARILGNFSDHLAPEQRYDAEADAVDALLDSYRAPHVDLDQLDQERAEPAP